MMPSPVTSTMLCGIGLTIGTSAALLPVRFNMLDCSSVRTSSLLMAFDVLTFHYDFFVQEYHYLLAALRQHVAIFCQWSSLPRKKRTDQTARLSLFYLLTCPPISLASTLPLTNLFFLFLWLKLIVLPYSFLLYLILSNDGGFFLDYNGNSSPAGSTGHHQHADLPTRFGGFDFSFLGGTL